MLLAWSYFIKITDPDILTGYNILGFDYKYLYERTQEVGIMEEYKELLPYGNKALINYMKNEFVDNLSRIELEDLPEY